MLQFILGCAGSGKTYAIREQAKMLAEQNGKKVLLLVPEQYSFETEKAMLKLLGPQKVHNVEVTSFTRLADRAFRAYGGSGIPKLDDGGRNIFMSLALEEVKEQLSFYVARSEELIPMMLKLSTELKLCAIAPQDLLETAKQAEDETLKQKMKEIGLILSAYDALVSQSYLDPLDDLQRLKTTFAQHTFFEGYHIYMDSFKGFTKQEFDLIELMMNQAVQVTISLTCDTLDQQTGAQVFARVRHTAHVLTRIARQNQVQVGAPILLEPGIRFENEALKQTEQQAFRLTKTPFTTKPQAISLYDGDTIYSEAAYIGATIRHLVMTKGYRYRDFAIIARSLEQYRGILDVALEQYQVPYFMDTARSIFAEPLMCLVLSALQIIKSGFSSDEVFAYLKTGLAGLTPYEISLLENYTFLWNLSGKKWLQEWTANADGFVEVQTPKQEQKLQELNQLRLRVVTPLLYLQKQLKDGSGLTFAKGMYRFLADLQVPASLQTLSQTLKQYGRLETAEQQVRLWNILMDILDQFASSLAQEQLSIQRFAELLRLMILSYDVTSIPQSLDHVTVGTADRMRPAQPKVVFVIGALQGEFPAVPGSGGVFSELERQALIQLGLQLSDTAEEIAIEEQYLAYAALTSASHSVYVTWHHTGLAGQTKAPSVIVDELRKLFPFLEVQTQASINQAWFACSKEAAFSMTAKEYRSQSALQSTLKALFLHRETYRERLLALDRAYQKQPHRFTNPEYAKRLFQSKTAISATQIEHYYLCGFQYFCRYGLNIKERKPAELDQLEYGSLIHYLLENIFKTYPAQDIIQMQADTLHQIIEELIAAYVETKLGGTQDKTPRFRFVFRRIADSAQVVIVHLAKELAQSKFQPIGHELSLKAGSDFSPLKVTLQDGSAVYVEGKIDRADVMELDGVRYMRVVDYKTGKKEFKLGDILHGINMQMLIYLAAFIQNGQYRPAGVLYMPASRPIIAASRSTKLEAVEKEINKQLRMNGVVVNDVKVICGMEQDAQGIYIPVALKDGAPKTQESVLNPCDMKRVLFHIEQLIKTMAQRLQQGFVEANPLQGAYDGCQYCPYFAVCQHEKEDGGNPQFCHKKDEVLEQLKQDGGKTDE